MDEIGRLGRDNWGWQARIGMFIVGNEAVPEAEMWAMAPPHVSIHAARVTASSPWAPWDTGRTTVSLADDLTRGCRQFAAMRLSAVVVGHSSSSFVGGVGWDRAVVAQLAEILGPEIALSTNGLDCQAALRHLGVTAPFLVIPPWYNDASLAAALEYLKAHELAPAGYLRQDPGIGWRDLAPESLYGHGMGFAQDVESLYRQIRAACPSAADGVLIAGTGFRCVAILEALEQDLGRPVVSANQASLWQGLRRAGVGRPVTGFGRLLRG